MYEAPIVLGASYSIMLLRIDTTEGEYDQSDETLIEYALTNIAAELFGTRMMLWHCTDMHGFIVCLLSDKPHLNTMEPAKISDEEDLDVWIETQAFQLQRAAKSYLKVGVSVLTSKKRPIPARHPDQLSVFTGEFQAFHRKRYRIVHLTGQGTEPR